MQSTEMSSLTQKGVLRRMKSSPIKAVNIYVCLLIQIVDLSKAVH